MRNYFKSKGCDVTDLIVKYDRKEATLSVYEIYKKLIGFRETLKLNDYDHGIIYYTGHGYKNSGNWVAADNSEISLTDIVRLF